MEFCYPSKKQHKKVFKFFSYEFSKPFHFIQFYSDPFHFIQNPDGMTMQDHTHLYAHDEQKL